MRPRRVTFEAAPTVVSPAPNRTDVACFVGFVTRRDDGTLGEPVRVDSWTEFDATFAWDRRAFVTNGDGHAVTVGATWLGAAVRAFFAEGGRTAYVVALGAPIDYRAPAGARRAARERLVPTVRVGAGRPDPSDRDTWNGVEHVLGLEDVSFVALPDLPELCADFAPAAAELEPDPALPEGFVECSTSTGPVEAREQRDLLALPAPRSTAAGYAAWLETVLAVRTLLRDAARSTQLVAALPLAAELDERQQLGRLDLNASFGATDREFVQLTFPWLVHDGAARTPSHVVPPDGAVLGVLARNAIARGTFRSVGALPLTSPLGLEPELAGSELLAAVGSDSGAPAFVEVVTVVGRTARGFELCSDVTPTRALPWRFGSICRFISALVAACRSTGEQLAFESSGPALWRRLRGAVEALLLDVWQAGALRGRTAADAFRVRCDRTTTTSNDLDAGRVVVEIEVQPAAPVERIHVRLDVRHGDVAATAAAAGGGGVA